MERIIDKNIVDMYKRDMTVFSLAVTHKRATPDYRDGQTEVTRRIIDAMCNNETKSINNLVKSAKIVGTTMGKSHPHGDTSIYGAMKGMTNWFDVYMPLLYTESNFGNFQGDGPAAQRYTEIKLSPFCKDFVVKDMLELKQSVDWRETYSGDDIEPEYLPTRVPLLLINGFFNIGIGERKTVPAHNINEVIDATINLIHDPNAPVVLIPDQCMPCEIIDTDWKEICNTGNGKYKVRGIIDIEDYKGVIDPKSKDKKHPKYIVEKKYIGCQTLVIKSLPDMVRLNTIEDKVEEFMKEGILPQIIDSIPSSTEFEPHHVFVLKKGSDPYYVRDMLYKKTSMSTTQTCNMVFVNGVEILRFSYKSYLQAWIEFSKLTKFRIYCNKLQKVKTDYHEKEAYIKVLESGNINQIIDTIRHRDTINDDDLIEWLIKSLDITDLQAKFIINASLKKLSIGYLNKYKEDAIRLKKLEEDYMNHILNDDLLLKEIEQDLLECKAKYGFPRRSKVVKLSNGEEIPGGLFKIVVTENNFIKKILVTDNPISYRGDRPKFIIKGDNRDNFIIFNEQGKAFKYPIHKIPLMANNTSGIDIRMIMKNCTSAIVNLFYEPVLVDLTKKKNKHFLVVLTKGNMIKKTDIDDILTVVPSGTIYTKLRESDIVIDVQVVPEVLDIVIYTHRKALRCQMSEIPHYKRHSYGVNAMNTNKEIEGMSVIYPDATDILIITESGKCNKFDISGLQRSNRYTAGSSVIRLNKTDSIKSILGVNTNDTVKITTSKTTELINVSDIPASSSVGGGTKLISIKSDNIIKVSLNKNI